MKTSLLIVSILLLASALLVSSQNTGDLLQGDYTDKQNTYLRIDVPKKDLAAVKEYSWSLWTRASFRNPHRVLLSDTRLNWISLAGISETGDWAPFDKFGQRTLASWMWPQGSLDSLDEMQYLFVCYSIAHKNPNAFEKLIADSQDYDSTWNYIYAGYSITDNRGFIYFKGGRSGEVHTITFEGFTHNNPPPGLMFSVGAPTVYFQPIGHIFNPQFHYTDGFYFDNQDAVTDYLKGSRVPPLFKPQPLAKAIVKGEKEFHKDDIFYEKDEYKWFQYSGAEEFAIQGWAKWDKTQEISKDYNSLLRITFNEPQDRVNKINVGAIDDHDRVFQLGLIDGKIRFTTQDIHLKGGDNLDVTQDVAYGDEIHDWFFFYIGHSFTKGRTTEYIKLANEEYQFQLYNKVVIPHYVGLRLGVDQAWGNWEGSVRDVVFRVGAGAYREYDFDVFMDLKDQKCGFIYSECNFQGDSVAICGPKSDIDPDFFVQSIRVPPRKKLKLVNIATLDGKAAEFTEDVSCLSNIDFAMFAQVGVKISARVEGEQQGLTDHIADGTKQNPMEIIQFDTEDEQDNQQQEQQANDQNESENNDNLDNDSTETVLIEKKPSKVSGKVRRNKNH